MNVNIIRAASSQKQIYYLNQLNPDSIGDNFAVTIEVIGRLDESRLQSAFELLIQRHETLRTSFSLVDGEVMQQINSDVAFQIKVSIDPGELKTVLTDFIKPFDFNQAPLLRVMLIKLAAVQSVIVIDMHHIIADGVSVNVIIRELIALYEGQTLPSCVSNIKIMLFGRTSGFKQMIFNVRKPFGLIFLRIS